MTPMAQGSTDVSNGSSDSSGGRMVATDGRVLPLRGATLRVDARGGVARVVLEQRFANPHDEPLSVTYLLPLPADGAVSGFAFRVGERRIVGEVDRKASARERFEQAILDGRSAALVEQERSSLFTQEIGNIPPHEEVVAEITVDQKLVWIDEGTSAGGWEWRFPTAVAPRYLGAPGSVVDAAKVSVDIASGALPVRMQLVLAIRDALSDGKRAESPSHTLATRAGLASVDVGFASENGVPLDRDVVVRWPVAAPRVGVSLDAARPSEGHRLAARAFGLLTLVPPVRTASPTANRAGVARDLIVLLDTSGSMGGEPLAQARRIVGALVDTLGDRDQLEMIEFSTEPRRWKRGAVSATTAHKKDAHAWLKKLSASGGTEMRTGILEALRPLRSESQRQVVLITDGLIGSETEVVRAISDGLPTGSRVHTVGVGSSVNRSLTGPAARAGRGLEVVVGLGEDPERCARRLVARTDAPLVVELELSGSALVAHAPERLPDLFASSPALVAVELRATGGELVVRGRTVDGAWQERITVPPLSPSSGGTGVVSLFGRERVEDLELRIAAGAASSEVDGLVETVGVDFQIATRLTSWVAISADKTVDPQAATRHERMPHELSYGMSAEGLGLRPVGGMPFGMPSAPPMGHGKGAASYAVMPHSAAAAPSVMAPMNLSRLVERASADAGGPSQPAPLPGGSARAMSGMPPVEPKEKKKGIGGLIGRLFGKSESAERDDEGAAEAQHEELSGALPALDSDGTADAPQASRKLRGKVVRRRGRELLVELELDAALDWRCPERLTVELDDGTRVEVQVDTGASTRSGALAAGLRVRIVLTLADESARPRALLLDGGTIVIDLSGSV